jgi:hypothetical protein
MKIERTKQSRRRKRKLENAVPTSREMSRTREKRTKTKRRKRYQGE